MAGGRPRGGEGKAGSNGRPTRRPTHGMNRNSTHLGVLRWGMLLLAPWLGGTGCGRHPEVSGEVPQSVYVWQRAWGPAVTNAVRERGASFASVIVLAGEVGWRAGRPELTQVAVDFEACRAARGPVGVALRVGGFAGPFRTNDAVFALLRDAAVGILGTARRGGVAPAEFQLDFDCAESRLGGYRDWVESLRGTLTPTPLHITALPSWLKRREFAGLARAADGYVLQVHSVERPSGPYAPFQLCDPERARLWVDAAARLGVPFRVALPTYGYLVAFDGSGRYLGASAEGPPAARPEGSQLREIGADPVRLGQLVADWTRRRPQAMRGVIWYRLPVEGDRLNWRWPTLAAVMAGRSPQARLFAGPTSGADGRDARLVEIQLRNEGDADFGGPASVRVRWGKPGEARLVARDAIRGFEAVEVGSVEILFTNAICRLPVGSALTIGWMRFDAEVSLECIPHPAAPFAEFDHANP